MRVETTQFLLKLLKLRCGIDDNSRSGSSPIAGDGVGGLLRDRSVDRGGGDVERGVGDWCCAVAVGAGNGTDGDLTCAVADGGGPSCIHAIGNSFNIGVGFKDGDGCRRYGVAVAGKTVGGGDKW